MPRLSSPVLACLALFGVLSIPVAPFASAASYLPLSDDDLARRAPLIVAAHVLARQSYVGSIGQLPAVFTRTILSPLEVLKGAMPAGPFAIDLPGGQSGTLRSWFPGTPEFTEGSDVVLFLSRDPLEEDLYRLTELALSRFDIVFDEAGRRFAVRPDFSPTEDDRVSNRRAVQPDGAGRPPSARDAESFLASLRSISTGSSAMTVYAAPQGELRIGRAAPRPLWVNIGGVENGAHALFRWFWDTGASPEGVVSVSGSQSNLSDGSDGAIHVQNAVAAWHDVADSDVRYRFSSSSGNVVVRLDVDDQSGAWSTPLPCDQGGVVGYGGPGSSEAAPDYRGDHPYYAIPSGTIWIRRLTGASGCYPASTFEAAVLHEMGHTLGLGHPDQAASIHSVLCPFDTCTAVMRSTLTEELTPQPDDISAIQWYYGAAQAPPAVSFFGPTTAVVEATVTFTDASSGNPTSWFWSFGDGATSTSQNPKHVFTHVGTYTVVLRATNQAGSATASHTVNVVTCSPDSGVSCRATPQVSSASSRSPRSVPARSPR